MLVAAVLGWLAGFVASAPVQLFELARIAAGDRRLLLDSSGYGLVVWGLMTLFMGTAAVIILLGPVATMVEARWVMRHPVLTVAVIPVLSFAVVSVKFSHWFELDPTPFIFQPMYQAYAIFIVAFFTVAMLMYVRLLRRGISRREETPGDSR